MSSVDMEKITEAMRAELESLGVPVLESIPADKQAVPSSCLRRPDALCEPGLCEDPRWCISDAWDAPEDEQRG